MANGGARLGLILLVGGTTLASVACGGDPDGPHASDRATAPSIAVTTMAPTPMTTTAPPPTPLATTAPPPTPLATTAPPSASVTAAAPDAGELVPAGLPALDGPVRTYEWPADRRPSRADLDALAGALGVTGDVAEGIYGTDRGWSLDGDNLELVLDAGPEGAWAYSGPPPFAWPSESEPWPTIATGEPVTIAPPTFAPGAPLADDFPSTQEATALARDIVAALGFDPEEFDWRDGSRTFTADVEAWWMVDGAVSPVKLDFGFGPDGRLVFASGQLMAPRAGPEVDRIGTAAAEGRLRTEIERTRGMPIEAIGLLGGVVAPGNPGATIVVPDPSERGTPPAAGDAGATTDVAHPTTAPPPTVPPEMVGRIVDVEASWHVVRSDAGTQLLPAYTYIEATGMRYTVSAAL